MLFDLYTPLSKTAKLNFSVKIKIVNRLSFILFINTFHSFLDLIILSTYICQKIPNCDEATQKNYLCFTFVQFIAVLTDYYTYS